MGFVAGVSSNFQSSDRNTTATTCRRSVRLHAGYQDSDRKKLEELVTRADETYDGPPPGKVKLGADVITEQKVALKALSDKWKKERIAKEVAKVQLFGWCQTAENYNCRVSTTAHTILNSAHEST